MSKYTGLTPNSPKNYQLGAGAIFVNYDMANDTFDSAVAAGKLLSATQGGGTFTAKPIYFQIEVDGQRGRYKGGDHIDYWEVTLGCTALEIKKEVWERALVAVSVDSTDAKYDVITGKSDFELSDYIDNITWVGRVARSQDPLVIQIYNAFNENGIEMNPQDAQASTVALNFIGTYDQGSETPPFKIYNPKEIVDATAPTVSTNITDGETGVVVSTDIVWTFDEAILATTVTNSNFIVMQSDGTTVSGTLSQSPDKTTITFSPTSDLSATTDYIAIVTTNVCDLYYNHLAIQDVINFTTA